MKLSNRVQGFPDGFAAPLAVFVRLGRGKFRHLLHIGKRCRVDIVQVSPFAPPLHGVFDVAASFLVALKAPLRKSTIHGLAEGSYKSGR
jgi:hypothetical protein